MWTGDQGQGVLLTLLQVGKYEVYMEVAKYLTWITSTIRNSGGLASCNAIMITADPVLGKITASHVLTDLPVYRGDGP